MPHQSSSPTSSPQIVVPWTPIRKYLIDPVWTSNDGHCRSWLANCDKPEKACMIRKGNRLTVKFKFAQGGPPPPKGEERRICKLKDIGVHVIFGEYSRVYSITRNARLDVFEDTFSAFKDIAHSESLLKRFDTPEDQLRIMLVQQVLAQLCGSEGSKLNKPCTV
jgi:hypothetical protein